MVLSHEETRLRGLTSAWLTVPVLAADPKFSKEVSFELEAGQTAHDTAEHLYARAADAFELGNYSTAASVLDRCVNAFPEHADCQRLLGDTYMHLGYRDEARAHYREFLRLAPDDGEAPRVRKIVEEYDRSKQR
jgi:tetratricopeptide (TPR) repeat protein